MGRVGNIVSDKYLKRNLYQLDPERFRHWCINQMIGNPLFTEKEIMQNSQVPIDGLIELVGDTILTYEGMVTIIDDFKMAGKLEMTSIMNRVISINSMDTDGSAKTDQEASDTDYGESDYNNFDVPILITHYGVRMNFRQADLVRKDKMDNLMRKVANQEEHFLFNGQAAKYEGGRASQVQGYGLMNSPNIHTTTNYDIAASDLYSNILTHVLDPLWNLGLGNIYLYVPLADKDVYSKPAFSGRQVSVAHMLTQGLGDVGGGRGMAHISGLRYVKSPALTTGKCIAMSMDTVDIVEAMGPAIFPVPAMNYGTSSALKMLCARQIRVKPDAQEKTGVMVAS